MKQTELLKKLDELDSKIASLGDIQAKAGEAEALLSSIRNAVNEANQGRDSVGQVKAEVQSAKDESIQAKDEILAQKPHAEKLIESIEETKKDAEEVSSEVAVLQEETKSLQMIIKDQLGLVNAGILSNSFNKEAENLEVSVRNRFKWITGVTILLFIVSLAVVIWELSTTNNFISPSFILKLSLTTPVIFFLIFLTKLHNREKRLMDEYKFKSTVALSFEAYRKLIKEDGSQPESQGKIVDFLIASINALYASPMDNLYKHNIKEDDVDLDVLGKIADIFKRIIK